MIDAMLPRLKQGRWRRYLMTPLLCLGLTTQAQAPLRLPSLGDGAEWALGEERQLGDAIMAQVWRDPDIIDDPVLLDYVQSLWTPLLSVARQRGELPAELDQRFAWDMVLVRDRSVNAFALPGGYMGVHLGLIAVASNRDELASVLAHETSHITQRHIARMLAQETKTTPLLLGTMLLGLLAASRSPDAAGALLIGGQAAAVQSQLSFSRDMEREADRVGFGLLTSAGFESQGAIGLFDKLIQAARLNDSGSYPYLRSHPMSTERMADMAGRAQQLGPSAPKAHTDVLHALMSARARALTDKSADAQRQLMLQAQERKATSGIVPPETLAAWYAGFAQRPSMAATAPKALDAKTKELIATALGVAAHCDACIGFHIDSLVKLGTTRAELEEALGMAVYMGGGPSLMYAADALGAFEEMSAA